jgi:hypothetical protein
VLIGLSGPPFVRVAKDGLIQHILRNRPKLYRRLGTIEPVAKEMGIAGVFSAEGEDWKRQRRRRICSCVSTGARRREALWLPHL